MNNSREIIIAIDAMGGDLAPSAVINGAFHIRVREEAQVQQVPSQIRSRSSGVLRKGHWGVRF